MSTELDPGERGALRRKARDATLAALTALGGQARRAPIRDRALARGGFTPRELAAAPPAGVAGRHDRLVTYELSRALIRLEKDGLVESRWGTWRLAGAAPTADRRPRPGLLRRLLAR